MPEGTTTTGTGNDQQSTQAPQTQTSGDSTNATRELLARIDALNTQVSKLQGEAGGYKSAAQKAQGELAELQSRYEERNSELASTRLQFEETQAKLQETLGMMAETVTQKEAAANKLQVYQEIATNPEYYPLLDMVDMLNLPDEPEARKETLDKLASKFTKTAQSSAEKAIADFAAGGTPSSGTGGEPAGGSAPKSFEEAIASAYNMLQSPNYSQQDFENALKEAQKLKQ